eukprot:9484187-Prorocentrum_lima.AAC.1
MVALAAEPALLLQGARADNWTALHALMSTGRHVLVKELVEAVDDEHRSSLISAQWHAHKWTALHISMGK